MNVSKCGKTLAAAWAAVMVMAAGTFAQEGAVFSYVITRSNTEPPSFAAVRNVPCVGMDCNLVTTNGVFQTVLNAIRTDALNRSDVGITSIAIQFENGTDVLDIGTASASFGNIGGQVWGNITISGKITASIPPNMVGSHPGTVDIGSGVSVTSTADITNTNVEMGGVAISVAVEGTVIITGGTITSTNSQLCQTIDKRVGEQSGFGSVVLGGSPTINGTIHTAKEKLSVITTGTDVFAPAGKQYTIAITGGAAGDVAVVGGKDFISNFILTNNGFSLTASGNDLVLFNGTSDTRVVTFDSRNGSYVAPQNIPNGGKVTKPADPTLANYYFAGWYVAVGGYLPAERLWNFDDDVVTSNITLNANWTTTPASVINRKSISANRLGIVQIGAGLRIVGTSQATPIRIYDMRGKLMMTRSAMPNEHISVGHLARGTYMVKAAGVNVRITR